MRTVNPTLWLALALALGSSACEEPDPAEACLDWEDPTVPCGGEAVYQACLEMAESCPGKDLMILESCPVQFACP